MVVVTTTNGLDQKDYVSWKARREKRRAENRPRQDASKGSIFDAMLSDETDLTKHGFISQETLGFLGK
jgi:hypothetical protein